MYTVIYKSELAHMFGYSMQYSYLIGEYLTDETFDDFNDAINYASENISDAMVVPSAVLNDDYIKGRINE